MKKQQQNKQTNKHETLIKRNDRKMTNYWKMYSIFNANLDTAILPVYCVQYRSV